MVGDQSRRLPSWDWLEQYGRFSFSSCRCCVAEWHTQVPHVVKVPETETRLSFVVRRISDALFFIFVMDIAAIYLKHNPITSSLAAERIQPSAQGPIFQMLSSLFYMANFWADSQLASCLLSAVAVGCGFSAPQSWPPLWGSWWDAFTVRRLWG